MRRREFIAGFSGAVAWPAVVRGQQDRVRRIGVLSTQGADDPDTRAQIEAFRSTSSAQPTASLPTEKYCRSGSTMMSKRSFDTSIPQTDCIFISSFLLMRARAQATVRVWKKRPELQAHWRIGIQRGDGLPVAAGKRS